MIIRYYEYWPQSGKLSSSSLCLLYFLFFIYLSRKKSIHNIAGNLTKEGAKHTFRALKGNQSHTIEVPKNFFTCQRRSFIKFWQNFETLLFKNETKVNLSIFLVLRKSSKNLFDWSKDRTKLCFDYFGRDLKKM